MLGRRWLVAAACLTAAAVLFTGQVRAAYWYAGHELSWPTALGISLVDWELWTVLAPLPLWLATRFPITRVRLAAALGIHVSAGVGLALVTTLAEGFLTRWVLSPLHIVFGVDKLYLALIVYGVFIGAVQFAEQRRLSQARELRGLQLEAELARAQVDALRMQLHPHFLFNTLHAISGLMHEDVEAADLMLAQLGDLLRRTLETEGRHEVSLIEELRWLRSYLAIQRTRFGDRLDVCIEMAPECGAALVPTLILQAVVENAVRHGFSALTGRGRIGIDARKSGERLQLEVWDDGPGVIEPLREGYGLRNTRARLRALYADAASVAVEGRPAGAGTISRIEMPFRVEAAA